MIGVTTVAEVIRDFDRNYHVRINSIIEDYGERREEVFGYILSFREHVSDQKLEELLRFLVFLVMVYQKEVGKSLYPPRRLILKNNRAVVAQVRYILEEDPSNLTRSVDLWFSGFEEKAILAYGMHEILERCSMETEEGIQMYIAVISLILIFSDEAKRRKKQP